MSALRVEGGATAWNIVRTSKFQARCSMDPARFHRLCAGLHRLSPRQLSELQARLAGLGARTETLAALDRRAAEIRACPRCGAEALGRWGVDRRGLWRLRCRACGRTCSAATGSPLGGLRRRPEAFREVLRDMVSAVRPAPCRRLAERFGVDKTTVWRRRMRILPAFGGRGRSKPPPGKPVRFRLSATPPRR